MTKIPQATRFTRGDSWHKFQAQKITCKDKETRPDIEETTEVEVNFIVIQIANVDEGTVHLSRLYIK